MTVRAVSRYNTATILPTSYRLTRREIGYYDLERTTGLDAQEALFVLRLQANEDAAYDELVRTYNASIFHVAYRMLSDSGEASDVVQEIFLKIFRNIRGFRGDSGLKTWIFRIAFSEILNRLRWWKRRHRFDTFSLDEDRGGEYREWQSRNSDLGFQADAGTGV